MVPGRILVRLKEPSGVQSLLGGLGRASQESAVRSAAGASSAQTLLPNLRVQRLHVPEGREGEAIARLRARADVLFAEEEVWLTHQATTAALPAASLAAPVTPNDPLYGGTSQWAPATIRLSDAWGITTGASSVKIGIVDTGIDGSHPEFSGRISDAARCINVTMISPCVSVTPAQMTDGNGHGTHVSGIAGATGNNGAGVAGVAWGTPLVVAGVFQQDSLGWFASSGDVAAGITWAVGRGAKVVNLSLGGPSNSATINASIDAAYNSGVLVVTAAGNCGAGGGSCGSLNEVEYPSAYALATTSQRVLPVASTDQSNARSSFSTQASYVTLGVSAPGTQIRSTYPLALAGGSGYASHSGTSMAAPHVAGLAALAYSINPNLTVDQVIALLKANVVDLGSAGADQSFGAGRIDALLAVTAAQATMATATPTRTATATLTATLTTTPGAAASATATAIPSATATATATPMPTATATATHTHLHVDSASFGDIHPCPHGNPGASCCSRSVIWWRRRQ